MRKERKEGRKDMEERKKSMNQKAKNKENQIICINAYGKLQSLHIAHKHIYTYIKRKGQKTENETKWSTIFREAKKIQMVKLVLQFTLFLFAH